MLNEVEVGKSLLENWKRDYEIWKENLKSQSISIFKNFEFSLDELLESIDELKTNGLWEFERKSENLLLSLTRYDDQLSKKI